MALGSTQPLVKMSTRNIPWGKSGRCVRLTTSLPSRVECHEIWEPKPPGTLWATPGLLRDSFTFYPFARGQNGQHWWSGHLEKDKNLLHLQAVELRNANHATVSLYRHYALHGRSQRVTIPDAVKYNFDLLKMNIVLLETCRGV
jgi:hypothetical protein